MYQEEIEKLIKYALVDGHISKKERDVLINKALKLGIDQEEFEMVLDARIYEKNNLNESKSSESDQTSIQKETKNIKCPNCQANIDSYVTSCEYCGYNVLERKSNSSIQSLFKLLNEAEEDRQSDPNSIFSSFGKVFSESFSHITGPNRVDRKKMEIISTFPIPTTKQDILEFLTLAYPKAKTVGNFFTKNTNENKLHNQFVLVWKNKCEQIIMKAKFSMKDDKETLNQVLFYAKKLGL